MVGTLPQLKLLALTDMTEEEIDSPRNRRSSRVVNYTRVQRSHTQLR